MSKCNPRPTYLPTLSLRIFSLSSHLFTIFYVQIFCTISTDISLHHQLTKHCVLRGEILTYEKILPEILPGTYRER